MSASDDSAMPRRRAFELPGGEVTVCEGGSGAHVVYLHGLCDVHSALEGDRWTPFLATLSARFSLVAPALPGYEGSSGPLGFDEVEDYVWHLVDLFDLLGLERVHLVGHSLGGWLAAELTLRHPGRVRRLVLIDPLGLHVDGADVPPFFAAVAPRGVGGFGEARAVLFSDPSSDVACSTLPDGMTRDQQLRWFGGLAGAAKLGWKAPHFQRRALGRRLWRIGAETLVLRGEDDLLVSDTAVTRWVEWMPAARLEQVPAAGHCLPLERPEVSRLVADFLSGEGPPPWT